MAGSARRNSAKLSHARDIADTPAINSAINSATPPYMLFFQGGKVLLGWVQEAALERTLPAVYLYLAHSHSSVVAAAHSLFCAILQIAPEVWLVMTFHYLQEPHSAVHSPVSAVATSRPVSIDIYIRAHTSCLVWRTPVAAQTAHLRPCGGIFLLA